MLKDKQRMMTYHTGKQKPGKAFKNPLFFLIALVLLDGCQTMTPPAPTPPQKTQIEKPVPITQAKKIHHIALLLPLSGRDSAIGDDLLKGAEMALFNSDRENIVIHVRDTAGTESGAVKALGDLKSIPLDGIIGPLFASEVRALSRHKGQKKTPILALSSDTSLAQKGVFVLGLSPQDQLREALHFAKQRGRSQVAAILPQGNFGDSMKAVLTAAAGDGWTVSSIVFYDTTGGLLAEQIDSLKNSAFDTLVVPVGGAELRGVLKSLHDENVSLDDIFVLGTGAWDDKNLPKDLLPQGAYYAAPDPEGRAAFEFSFEKTYGQKPKRMATLTYDATKILIGALTQTGGSLYDQLTNPAGFDGLDGYFRLSPDGSIKRTLVIMNAGDHGGGHLLSVSK